MTIRFTRTAAAVGTATVLMAAGAMVALAAPIKGTNGPDTLTGTDARDRIAARAGDDVVNALAGRDRVRAGKGNDTVDAGRGRDKVWGGEGDDTLSGGPGRDLIYAQRGVDTVNGGDGPDNLWALARKDVTGETGETADTVNGEAGRDRIHVRDGEPDTVTCGTGFDVVRADHRDQVANDCELVKRRVPRPSDDE